MKREEDHYARLARNQGYPARSVFKLMEIQSRFSLVRRGDRILDVGSSPGSWSLYLIRELKARVVGVDLEAPKIAPVPGSFTFIHGDIFDGETLERIVSSGPYDVVVSDAAPSTSGNRIVDGMRSTSLVERVLEMASDVLVEGGNLVVKIFQAGEERRMLQRLRGSFKSGRAFKPRASRKGSFETYLIGSGFLEKKYLT